MQVSNVSNSQSTNFKGCLDDKSIEVAKKAGGKVLKEAEKFASRIHKDSVVSIREGIVNEHDAYVVTISNDTMNIKDFCLGTVLKKGGVKFDKWLRGCKGKLLDIDMYNTAVYNYAKKMAEDLRIKIKPFAVQNYKGNEFVCGRFLKDGKFNVTKRLSQEDAERLGFPSKFYPRVNIKK